MVAVELTTRSLLWGYRYNRSQEAMQNASNLAMRMAMMRGNEPAERWADSGATVVDGKVLISPLESEEILCLNLVDGKLLWKQPRQEDLYLACVDQGRVVLVGHQQLRFLNLANGEPAWEGRTVAPARRNRSQRTGIPRRACLLRAPEQRGSRRRGPRPGTHYPRFQIAGRAMSRAI